MRSNDWYQQQGELLKVLGHPVRLKIVDGLLRHECHVNKIVEGLGLPQSTVSQHLALLRNKGIIAPQKDGVKICYQVVDDRVKALIAVLQKKGVSS